MFTGLIEAVEVVKGIRRGVGAEGLTLEISFDSAELRRGESIAVNGCCLTVVGVRGKSFSAQVSRESRERTTLGLLREGDKVNLERALKVGDRLGGHLVSGHIDGKGTIRKIIPEFRSARVEINTSKEIARYLIKKGSVAVDGVSLTVNELKGECFNVNIISYTMENTIFEYRKVGDEVNIENDLLGKYVERFLTVREGNRDRERIGLDFLAEHGFS